MRCLNLLLASMSPSEMFAEALCSQDYSRCLAELEEVPVSSLWPRNGTLRALASLLTAEHPQVNKAAADYLSSASHSRFRIRVSSVFDGQGGAMGGKTAFLNSVDGCHEPRCECLCGFPQAVECYTHALSEAGVQSQRAACSALSCLQVGGQ